MKLIGAGGDLLELEIVGYEFPAARHPSDLSWLVVRMDARVQGRSWSSIGPYLMTDEVDLLATCLELAPQGYGAGRDIEFLEPNLALEIRDSTGAEVELRAWFELEFRPPWAKAEGAPMRDFAADLTVSRAELAAAATDLWEQRSGFPDRVPPSS